MRKAISLIELVLAIVVIAISVMSVPMMLQQGTHNDTYSMMQESILAARTKMGNILSYQWDDNAREANNTNGRLRVLNVYSGDPALDRNGTYYPERRIGHVFGNLRRKMMPSPTYPKPGNDANITDLNDFDGQVTQIMWAGASSASDRYDYLDKNLTLDTGIYYISDTLPAGEDYNATVLNFVFDPSTKASIANNAGSTNIKMIELQVTSNLQANSNEKNTTFLFRAFSCNLGEGDLNERVIP